jgi:hypothetical protein
MARKKMRIVVIDDSPADAGILRRNLDKTLPSTSF